jgi:ubiquinone/menaquinone biosynthesis C-methylase UbiE
VTGVQDLSGRALKQGELWGHGARDWAALQEPGAEPLWNAVLDAARVGPATRLLDAGCGAGGAAVLAAQRGAEVFGIDVSANLITIAHRRLPRADFRVAELEDLPFPDGGFDAAVAVNSLQYVSNAQLAIVELGRVCRRGGRVVAAGMSDPDRCDMAAIFRAIVDLFERPPAGRGPFTLSAPGALESLVQSVAGLRMESIDEIDCTHEYPDLDAALRGQMSAGATWRAVEIQGEERVRTAVRSALERFLQPDGKVRMENRYRYAVAVRD